MNDFRPCCARRDFSRERRSRAQVGRRVPVNALRVRLATPGPYGLLPERMKTRLSTPLRLLFILLSLPAAAAASADTGTAEPVWRFGGFGTFGAGYHGSDGLTYRRDLEQGAGHDGGRLGFRGDSRIGVQASATFDSRWSAQIQSVSRLDSEGKWTPQLSWTFLRYSPSDTLDVRVGRLGVDLYLDGDSRHVGYAFTTVRPAPEVLGVVTQDLFDGVDVTARHPAGAGLLSLRLYGGRSRGNLSLYGSQYRPPDAQRLGRPSVMTFQEPPHLPCSLPIRQRTGSVNQRAARR